MFQLLGLLVLTVAGGIAQVDGAINWYGTLGISDTTLDLYDAEYDCSLNGGVIYADLVDTDPSSSVFKNNALLNKQYWYHDSSNWLGNECWTVRYNGQMLQHTRYQGSSCTGLTKRYLCWRPPPPPCLEGQVKRFKQPGRCFQHIAEKMNMSEAVDHCTALIGITGASGHIMEMTDVVRYKLAMKIDQDEQIWVGCKKNEAGDGWIWIYSGLPLEDTQARWNAGEPSGDGECVNTYLYDRTKWADTLCRIKRAFICEFEAQA